MWGSWTGQAPSMLCRAPALPAISAGEWANGISARRGQGQGRTADLPLFRSTVIPRALTWKRLQQPSSLASTLVSGVLRTFNRRNKCTGVCRLVRGISVGIGDRVAELWGFCGRAAEASGWSGQPRPEHQTPQLPESDDHFPSNLASPGGQPFRGDSALGC